MFKRFIAVCMVLCSVFAVGCATAAEAPETESAVKAAELFPPAREAAAKALAEKLVNGLVESLRSGDFAAFRAAQPQGARVFKPEAFDQMRGALSKRYGKLVSSEYFGRLDQGRVMDFLWKLSFERADGTGKTMRHQIICWVRIGVVNGEPAVAGFSFNFF